MASASTPAASSGAPVLAAAQLAVHQRQPQLPRHAGPGRGVGRVLGELDQQPVAVRRRGPGPPRRWRPRGTAPARPPTPRAPGPGSRRCRRGRSRGHGRAAAGAEHERPGSAVAERLRLGIVDVGRDRALLDLQRRCRRTPGSPAWRPAAARRAPPSARRSRSRRRRPCRRAGRTRCRTHRRRPAASRRAAGRSRRCRSGRARARPSGCPGRRPPRTTGPAVSSRPSRDSTRGRPRPSSKATLSTSGSSDSRYAGASRSSSAGVGSRSPTPRSPGRSRSDQGTHSGREQRAVAGQQDHLVDGDQPGARRAGDGDRPAPARVAGHGGGEEVGDHPVALGPDAEVLAGGRPRRRPARRRRRGRRRPRRWHRGGWTLRSSSARPHGPPRPRPDRRSGAAGWAHARMARATGAAGPRRPAGRRRARCGPGRPGRGSGRR